MTGELLLLFLIGFPIVGAIITYLIGTQYKNTRDYFANGIVIVEFLIAFLLCIVVAKNEIVLQFHWNGFLGQGMYLVLDGFRAIYGVITAFLWMMTTIFSREYFAKETHTNRYYLFMLFTLGVTMGVFLSADLYTTFLFFELMSLTSFVMVIQEENRAAINAAKTYLAIAIISGLIMLMGIFLLYDAIGTLQIGELRDACNAFPDKKRLYIAGACIFLGFSAKAGAFPLHIWLPKAYPESPAPASAILSGSLSKVGIFGMVIVSCQMFFADAMWGGVVLIIGIITMLVGAIRALFSNQVKEILAFSSMSQIGFIIVGIGMCGLLGANNLLAARGGFLHMINHSFVKLLLFMIAGIVFMNVQTLNLNEVRGFGRNKPMLHITFLIGALGIGGIPSFNGYISKTLLHESIIEFKEALNMGVQVGQVNPLHFMNAVEIIFLLSGGITIAYITKIYSCLFLEKNVSIKKQEEFDGMKKYYNSATGIALIGSVIILPLIGMLPTIIADPLITMGQGFFGAENSFEKVRYFTFENIKGSFISISVGVILYFGFVRIALMQKKNGRSTYLDIWPKWFTLEKLFYKPIFVYAAPFIFGFLCRVLDSLVDGGVVLLRKTIYKNRKIPCELSEGTAFTYHSGQILDSFVTFKSRFSKKESKDKISYKHKFAVMHEELQENNMIIARSLSFGLFMFCLGLSLTLIYLLIG